MITKTRQHGLAFAAGLWLGACSLSASAHFYIDYQGVEKQALLQGPPEGYRVLADKTYGIVHQVGEGRAEPTDSFGVDLPLKEAVFTIMPESWVAYIDETIETPATVGWRATHEPWTQVLGQLGVNYGYRFIVDWDQKLLQISSDEDFTPPNFNDPVVLTDPESGRTIFVYSAKPGTEGGVIIVGGKAVPVKIK